MKLKMPSMSKIRVPKFQIRRDIFFAVLAYIPVLNLLSLIFKRKDYFVEYHVRQGMALLILVVVGSFSFYAPVLPYIFALLFLILFLTGIINIILRREKPLPLLGKWAEGFNI
jgi:hypothetical protein